MYTSALYSSTALEYFSAAFIAFFKIGSTGSSAKTLKVVEVNEYKNKKRILYCFSSFLVLVRLTKLHVLFNNVYFCNKNNNSH